MCAWCKKLCRLQKSDQNCRAIVGSPDYRDRPMHVSNPKNFMIYGMVAFSKLKLGGKFSSYRFKVRRFVELRKRLRIRPSASILDCPVLRYTDKS